MVAVLMVMQGGCPSTGLSRAAFSADLVRQLRLPGESAERLAVRPDVTRAVVAVAGD